MFMEKTKLQQSGIALPMVLIFLVVMMLIGTVAIRNVTLDEKMAANTRNQQAAFQAAERALRYCEAGAQNNSIGGKALSSMLTTSTTSPSVWDNSATWGTSAPATTAKLPAVTLPNGVSWTGGTPPQPQCIIEDVTATIGLGPTQPKRDLTDKVYRITGRGTDVTNNAVVLLQSYLKF
ncbi:type IV pilus assembly protein PilX [Collimonas fungivorans Ter331]|uniref:Type IV pilus assembly protein PilX n=2 Tax=Collimonas fungivorans TaxID=158899 RepID=G0ADG6_COLFT|nr:type IV pilus assembly protein PilX [Collimonas fungivorans Ter331]